MFLKQEKPEMGDFEETLAHKEKCLENFNILRKYFETAFTPANNEFNLSFSTKT